MRESGCSARDAPYARHDDLVAVHMLAPLMSALVSQALIEAGVHAQPMQPQSVLVGAQRHAAALDCAAEDLPGCAVGGRAGAGEGDVLELEE